MRRAGGGVEQSQKMYTARESFMRTLKMERFRKQVCFKKYIAVVGGLVFSTKK